MNIRTGEGFSFARAWTHHRVGVCLLLLEVNDYILLLTLTVL